MSSFTQLLITLAQFVVFVRAEDEGLTYVEPGNCLLSKNETFSPIRLGCVKCNWEFSARNESTSTHELKFEHGNCPCPPGYWRKGRHCNLCQQGTVSPDQTTCLQCTNPNLYNSTYRKCSPCPIGYIQVARNYTGAPLKMLECVQCADGWTPSSSAEACVSCHSSFSKLNSTNGTCNCQESTHSLINGVCIPVKDLLELSVDRKDLFKIHYENGISIESPFLRENLLLAYYTCRTGKNESACQILANSCTMLLYSSPASGDDACSLYDKISGSHDGVAETRETLPKLIYEDHYRILQTPNFIPKEFTSNFEDSSSDINMTVAKYSVDGKFLGLHSLIDVLPCPGQKESRRISEKFGATTKTVCAIRATEFWEQYKDTEMEFLDSFLRIRSEKREALYPVPIKIMNYEKNDVYVNELAESFQWYLVRRFFMVDTVGGAEAGIALEHRKKSSGKFPKMIRYIEKMHVGIQLQKQGNAGRIYVPIITVWYNQLSADDYKANPEIKFTYEVEYFMEMSDSVEGIKISVGVMCSLGVIWAMLQTWGWNRRNGRAEIDLETILNLFFTSCGHIADAFVIVCFSTSLYWWFFFKNQVAVHVFLPQPPQARIIRDLLISAFSLKLVDVLKLIWRQVNVDIFFVDWEKPKTGSVIHGPSEELGRAGSNIPEKEESLRVSVWRSYFVANEWNEIQSLRKINMALHIVFTLLMLEVFGLKHWGLHWPNGSLSPGPEASGIPYSTVARFTTSTLLFSTIGFLQWLYRIGFYERFVSNKIQDFVDICTLANISVFILYARQYGFYIHGRSVHGFADTDMHTMVEQLSREEEDLCGRRGLVATYDQQTFIISVPRSLRSVYDQVLQPLYMTSKLAGQRQGNLLGGSKGTGGGIAKPSSSQLNLSAHAYHSMNRFLTSFLEHALSDIDYEVNDKSFIETTLDMEFREGGDRAVFYNDNGHAFDSVLFYGNERTLFLFNLYLFNFVDLLSHDFVLAGIITYLGDMVFKHLRNSLGKRNIARKTLIDRRFLI